jgi:hypothetical protein
MITWPAATRLIIGTCAATLGGLAGCNKAPPPRGATPQAAATAGSSATPTASLTAGLQEPPLEVPAHGNNPEVAATAQKYVQWITEKAMPAGLHKPAFPNPNRADQTARLLRYKYGLWGVAETKVASDAALKQQAQFLGLDKPPPNGNYGRMNHGLPTADHK